MASQADGFLGKLEVTNEIGEQLDKQLTQAENQVQQLQGGGSALKLGAIKVGELGTHVDKDLEEGKLTFESEIATATYVKSYLRRAGEVLLNLAERSKAEEMIAHGKVAAHKESLEIVKRHCLSAKARLEQLVAASQEAAQEAAGETPAEEFPGDRHNRRPGQHPGPSTLDERRAERDAGKAAEAQSAVKSPPEASLNDPSAGKKAKKRKAQPLIAT